MMRSVLFGLAIAAWIASEAKAQDISPGQAIAQAWASGDLANAGELAVAAFETIETSPCAVSPDAARLAYVAGFADFAPNASTPRGYLFWVAATIHDQVGGLSDAEIATARHYLREPGQDRHYDRLFAASKYFMDPPEPRDDCPRQFTNLLVSPPAGATDSMMVLISARGERADFFRDVVFINGYPADEARAFAGGLENLSPYQPTLYWSRSREYAPNEEHGFVIRDCRTFWTRDRERVSRCREGASPPEGNHRP